MTIDTDMTPPVLLDEFRRLSLALSQGDTSAEKQLAAVEAKLEAITRQERRREAAIQEERRVAGEAERQATIDAHAENERLRLVALETKDRCYDLVEQCVNELSEAVKLALLAGDDARAAQLRLGYSAGRTARSELSTYIADKLGRTGGAGLDFQYIASGLRGPLVTPLVNQEQ